MVMNMEYVILKFGGSCLKNKNDFFNVSNIIKGFKNKKIVIVVSAMGRKGFPYATDTLLAELEDINITPKELDAYISTGEIISSVKLCNFLLMQGHTTRALSPNEIGIECDNTYQNGHVETLCDAFYIKYFQDYDCLIVPGFMGLSQENEIITLGRNTSDYTAILLALLLKTNEVYLYKDVQGILPFNSSPIKNIIPYKALNYEDMEKLLSLDDKVLSFKALNVAKENDIKINIMNFKENKLGTTISKDEAIKDVLGFKINHHAFTIITEFPCKIKEEIEQFAYEHHVIIKDQFVDLDRYYFKINPSQLAIVKHFVVNSYFNGYFLP